MGRQERQESDRKRVVLVVEDDGPIGQLLSDIINDEIGYVAIHVTRPADALATMREVTADLVVLDVNLPGMSGLELYDRMRQEERLAQVPVLFETALAQQYRGEFKRRGIEHVLEKPFHVDDLVREVEVLAPAS